MMTSWRLPSHVERETAKIKLKRSSTRMLAVLGLCIGVIAAFKLHETTGMIALIVAIVIQLGLMSTISHRN